MTHPRAASLPTPIVFVVSDDVAGEKNGTTQTCLPGYSKCGSMVTARRQERQFTSMLRLQATMLAQDGYLVLALMLVVRARRLDHALTRSS
jgi:hypothetical protein